MYSLEGLLHGIDRAKVNIKSLEAAIETERKTIADYKIMISQIEEADKKKQEAERNVEIVYDGPH